MRLFYDTVHAINCRDYSPEQVEAWAPATMDAELWAARQESRTVFVAEQDGRILGFGELLSDGHIDRFFSHKDYQGKGVGTALMEAIVTEARRIGVSRLHSNVSITARPFFERRGFRVVTAQEVERRGVTFRNYKMERFL